MEWQVFCFSVLYLGPFYFKFFGACAISTPNNIRSKRHLWQKENIVQMRSGLTDKQWCEAHQICPSNFYYQIKKFRNKACEIPESQSKTGSCSGYIWTAGCIGTSSVLSAKVRKGRCSNSCTDQWLSDRNHKCSVRKCNLSYSVSAASTVLGDLSGVSRIYLVTGLSSEYFYPHLFWIKMRITYFMR